MIKNEDNILSEVTYKSSRSGGKGGQNVNKVETKIELSFDIPNSKFLSDEDKERLLKKLSNRTDKNGILKITSQVERSQYLNKLRVNKKITELIKSGLKKEKKRLKTKPTIISKENRIQKKKIKSYKKSQRSKPAIDE
ncbi:MAG TPA: alternative ribosome rescue aminoacyl-tRNA hydrolase ArfB [Ignavibacteria bacterium]